jgi:alpha-tubulin suppressor-like RCC1 family protein
MLRAGTDWAGPGLGKNHTCGTKTDHTLWCWGWNHYGQLGLGHTLDRFLPRQV